MRKNLPVTSILAEISTASSAQSAGIKQVNPSITQRDEVIQQAANLPAPKYLN